MKRFARLTWGMGLAALSATAIPEAPPDAFAAATPASATAAFDPYRVIIDRAIFGRPPVRPAPPVPAPDLAAQKQAEALARKITMCAVNRTPSGNTAVGLIDNDAKPPRNIYLNVGDTADGYTILAADYDAETATIEKEGVVITLKLGKGLIGTGAPVAVAAAAAGPARPRDDVRRAPAPEKEKRAPAFRTVTEQLIAMELSVPPGVPAPPPPLNAVTDDDARAALDAAIIITDDDDEGLAARKIDVGWAKEDMRQHLDEGGSAKSYLEQLRKRRQEEAERHQAARNQLQELARQFTEEELRQRERQINLSLIEQGARPITDIELTPEEEADLVDKGILAP